jgi:tol-pal system protein YbgF
LLTTGCLAQKAELSQVQRDLETKISKEISKLDQKEKDLQKRMNDANALLVEFDSRAKETRASLRNEIQQLRDDDLRQFQGELEKTGQRVKALEQNVDDRTAELKQIMAKRDAEQEKRAASIEKVLNDQNASQKADREHLYQELGKLGTRMDAMTGTMVDVTRKLEGRLLEHDKALGATDARTGGLTQQLEAQNRLLVDQTAQFRASLTEFKQALTVLSEKLAQQDQRTQELSANLSGQTDALTAKVEADAKATSAHLAEVHRKIEADAKATTAYLDQVKKSVGSVHKALETVGGTLIERIEVQDRRLGAMSQALPSVTTQVSALVAQSEEQNRRLDDMAKTMHGITVQVNALTHQVTQLEVARRAKTGHGTGPAGQDTRNDQTPPLAQQPDQTRSLDSMTPAGDAVEAAPASAPAPVSGEPVQEVAGEPAQGDRAAGAKEAYERSLQKFKQGNVAAALKGFSEFLAKYPASELTPNAHYWLGECYYKRNEFRRAIDAFDRVRLDYPASPKAPAALFRKGLAYLALKDRKQASSVLRQVVDTYPKSLEASKALDKLMQLKQVR